MNRRNCLKYFGGLMTLSGGLSRGVIGKSASYPQAQADSSDLFKKILDASIGKVGPTVIDQEIFINKPFDYDFRGHSVSIKFSSTIYGNNTSIIFRNLGRGSVVDSINVVNNTAPWSISRWNKNGAWINSPKSVIATLSRSNADGYYQPTPNDKDIWDNLPLYVKNQNCSTRVLFVSSTDIALISPCGRSVVYEMKNCHNFIVDKPNIASGGKGIFGTIVFDNSNSGEYGVGNFVRGGICRYGSYSGIVFLRNKKGGVIGTTIYRCGESGIKTYQNEINGRSARCYEMIITNTKSVQCVYDGIDISSDYGDTPKERVADYSLSEYGWHNLPTKHVLTGSECNGCNGAGIWGDGAGNKISGVDINKCRKSGIKLISNDVVISDSLLTDNNTGNSATGEHQISVKGAPQASTHRNCYISNIKISTGDNVRYGRDLYAPSAILKKIAIYKH